MPYRIPVSQLITKTSEERRAFVVPRFLSQALKHFAPYRQLKRQNVRDTANREREKGGRGGVTGLKDLTMNVPAMVRSGDTVTLSCHYDLEGLPLYKIQWMLEEVEFYRNAPDQDPPYKTYDVDGVHVNVSKSNTHDVTLTNVSRKLTGEYKCEVSGGRPSYHTDIRKARMEVVGFREKRDSALSYHGKRNVPAGSFPCNGNPKVGALITHGLGPVSGQVHPLGLAAESRNCETCDDAPKTDPTIGIEKERIAVGELLRANCTTGNSRPASAITWKLNGDLVPRRWETSDASELSASEIIEMRLGETISLLRRDETFECRTDLDLEQMLPFLGTRDINATSLIEISILSMGKNRWKNIVTLGTIQWRRIAMAVKKEWCLKLYNKEHELHNEGWNDWITLKNAISSATSSEGQSLRENQSKHFQSFVESNCRMRGNSSEPRGSVPRAERTRPGFCPGGPTAGIFVLARRASPCDVDIPGGGGDALSRDHPTTNLAGDKVGPSEKGNGSDKAQALCIMFYEQRPRSPVSSRVRGLNAQTRLFPEIGNDSMVYRTRHLAIPQDDGSQVSKSTIEFKVTNDMFQNGRLHLRCTAFIADVYRKTADMEISEDAPRIASITGESPPRGHRE
ncbi:hypothetical protein WN48_10078 [Eufriesea mexicana]|uniref:Ig-like domain-containing protein n=1 Tax=Eufriesea mexicana TaxID=516756 RepID=A0A310SSI3_9HYME|nr:hypothetical protein WN48_10078 [Eufriesea mexicana]